MIQQVCTFAVLTVGKRSGNNRNGEGTEQL